ncbi:hypothetical protein HRR95_006657 [Exophiala dermatitidis]|nr:hypothetical protein HRR85_003185 [Exophiala dermatitidis]KAJ4672293.1 hypothetical protein HRR95_006657 [Exophiala dermatitidis]
MTRPLMRSVTMGLRRFQYLSPLGVGARCASGVTVGASGVTVGVSGVTVGVSGVTVGAGVTVGVDVEKPLVQLVLEDFTSGRCQRNTPLGLDGRKVSLGLSLTCCCGGGRGAKPLVRAPFSFQAVFINIELYRIQHRHYGHGRKE